MKKLSSVFIPAMALVIAVALAGTAYASNIYVAQAALGGKSGADCSNARALSSLTATDEAPGNTIHLCGTFTSGFSVLGGGTSGNVLTFKWESGARISVAYGQIINVGARSYVLFDGGTACGPGTTCDTVEASNLTGYASGQAGIVEATANGSGLANQNTSTQAFYGCNSCHDIEIKNLIIRNLYQHTSTTDTTSSADTGTFAFQYPYSTTGAAGTISIHDSTLHDMGEAVSIQRGLNTVFDFYNLDLYRNNWAFENSGNGTRTILIHNNHVHDAKNWDTSSDDFHHNGLHNYINVASDSIGLYIYNNLHDGDWGSCCTTATFLFTEVAPPASFYVWNNVILQSCNNNTAMASQSYTVNSGQGPSYYNNTFVGCSTTSGNVEAVDLYGAALNWKNNAVQGYGQYVSVGSSASFNSLDYNVYGVVGVSGNSPWKCGSTSASTFSTWQSSCHGDSNGKKASDLNITAAGVPNAGSSLISAAANLTSLCSGYLAALCSDYNGKSRPTSGAWDAGAYSYGSSPNSPTGLTGVTVQQ